MIFYALKVRGICKKEKKKKKETYFHCIIKAKQNIRCKQRLSILEK